MLVGIGMVGLIVGGVMNMPTIMAAMDLGGILGAIAA
jgi:hypothetical protein